MKFNGMKCVLLVALVAPLSFGAFADQGQSPKPERTSRRVGIR